MNSLAKLVCSGVRAEIFRVLFGLGAGEFWLKPHKTSRQEIGNLLAIVRRDLADARAKVISDDWRFGIAYNSAWRQCSWFHSSSGSGPKNVRVIPSVPIGASVESPRLCLA